MSGRIMQNNRVLKLFIIVVFIFGAVIPFVDELVIIQFYYYTFVSIAILFIASVAYIVQWWAFRTDRNNSALLLYLVVPTFIASQFISMLTVSNIQRFRSNRLIAEIESTGSITNSIRSRACLGINLTESGQADTYEVSYSKGFFVREIYRSSTRIWKTPDLDDYFI